MKKISALLLVAILIVVLMITTVGVTKAAILTFDDLITGATTYSFDGDGDFVSDVIFSTTDPFGFNTVGPGPNMSYINEPGLEGTSLLNPDLRVDFLVGATGSLSFGFALNSFTEDDYAAFYVYDAASNLLASTSVTGLYTSTLLGTSSFPEGQVTVSYLGTADYALFDFTSDFGRYIIDNFEGTFGTTEISVPEPSTLLLLGSGLAGLGLWRRMRKDRV